MARKKSDAAPAAQKKSMSKDSRNLVAAIFGPLPSRTWRGLLTPRRPRCRSWCRCPPRSAPRSRAGHMARSAPSSLDPRPPMREGLRSISVSMCEGALPAEVDTDIDRGGSRGSGVEDAIDHGEDVIDAINGVFELAEDLFGVVDVPARSRRNREVRDRTSEGRDSAALAYMWQLMQPSLPPCQGRNSQFTIYNCENEACLWQVAA